MLTIDEDFELRIPIQVQENLGQELEFNVTDVFSKTASTGSTEVNAMGADYEQFLADVWVGIVLTLMVLSCVCFMCSCLIYHKFQQWKSRGKVLQLDHNFLNLRKVTEFLFLFIFPAIKTNNSAAKN